MALTRGEWIALVLAIAMAHAFYGRIVHYPSDFDAKNYLDIAQDMLRQGLFSKFFYSNIRTYGYPAFLAILLELAGSSASRWGWLIFESQLALFITAAVMLRRSMLPLAPRFARLAFIALIVNPFVLSYTPESLSESLALTLVIASIACWISARRHARAWIWVLLGSMLVSFSVMVRPANVFALAAWVVAVGLLVVERQRKVAGALPTILLALVVGIVVPALPQLRNNVRYYHDPTPLVVARLATNQQIWGIQYIKYATAMPPVPLPSVFYDNPWARDRPFDAVHPLRWYTAYPDAGLATLALHVFNMLDQDLLFTYARDLDPWYRRPLAIANHALIAFALIGLALLIAQRARWIEALSLSVLIAAHVTVHAATAVEMRFGLPLLALGGPLAAFAWMRMSIIRSRVLTIGALVFAAAYVTCALVLSDWVRSQSPSIVAWQARH